MLFCYWKGLYKLLVWCSWLIDLFGREYNVLMHNSNYKNVLICSCLTALIFYILYWSYRFGMSFVDLESDSSTNPHTHFRVVFH